MNPPYFEELNGTHLENDLNTNLLLISTVLGDSADFNKIIININGTGCAVLSIEGMASTQLMGELIYQPLTDLAVQKITREELHRFVAEGSLMSADRQSVDQIGKLTELLFSGFAAVVTDGFAEAVCFGIQGFEKRAVSLPETEQTISGARDSFNESLRTNMSLVRRRLKTPALRFKLLQAGKLSRTDISVAYIEGRADPETVDIVQQELMSIELDTLLNSGYIMPFIDRTYGQSFFSALIVTERPDVACAALNEGKILVFIDGTPECIMLPTVFADNFRTMDDYSQKPLFAAFSRWLKYLAFLLAVFLPGLYAALVTFHPEVFPLKLLLNLAAAEEATPYPLVVEIALLLVLFEVMREAGVRLPKAVGGAVSIVGGLIIGDAAVKSGLVSQPLLIVVGITATASFVLPSLYSSLSLLRLIFVLAGGLGGLYGIAVVSLLLVFNIASADQYGAAFTSPLMPLKTHGFGDIFFRPDFPALQTRHTTIADRK